MMTNNIVWLAYSLKINSIDLIVVNGLGTLVSITWIALYIYVKSKVARFLDHLPRLACAIIFAILVSSSLTDDWMNGLIATSMSMTVYLFTLEGVKGILQTKDPNKVDVIIAIACIFNSLAWGTYAKLVGDAFVFVPNIAAFGAGWINIFLYMWTTDQLSDNALPIKMLHRCCLKKSATLPKETRAEPGEGGDDDSITFSVEPEDSNSHEMQLR